MALLNVVQIGAWDMLMCCVSLCLRHWSRFGCILSWCHQWQRSQGESELDYTDENPLPLSNSCS